MTMAGMTDSDAAASTPSDVTEVPVASDSVDPGVDTPDDANRSEPYVAGVGGVVPPERLTARPPRLPMSSRLRTVHGQVILQAMVLKDGKVGDVQVQRVTEPGHGLEQAAVRAVKKWRYKPATLNGVPVDALINVAVNFE